MKIKIEDDAGRVVFCWEFVDGCKLYQPDKDFRVQDIRIVTPGGGEMLAGVLVNVERAAKFLPNADNST